MTIEEDEDDLGGGYYEDVKCECCGSVVTVVCADCVKVMDWRCYDNHECEKKEPRKTRWSNSSK